MAPETEINPEPHTLRRAIEADLNGLLDLYRYLNPRDPWPDPDRSKIAWAALLGSTNTTVYVAETGGRLVGSCTLIIVPNLTRGARPYGLIENVVTHAEARRRGIGHAVLKIALENAWAADCYKVMLMTGRKDEGTLKFYEAAGFERGKTAFEIRRE
jgi:ribosomal protein S18 acetylase RimI-like enzyme